MSCAVDARCADTTPQHSLDAGWAAPALATGRATNAPGAANAALIRAVRIFMRPPKEWTDRFVRPPAALGRVFDAHSGADGSSPISRPRRLPPRPAAP